MFFGIVRRTVAVVLVAAQLVCLAQDAGTPKLNIVIIEGDGAINNIKQRTAREVIVEVQDDNHRPVAGALVAFTLPTHGATGILPGGQSALSVTTDGAGRATLSNLQPSGVGKYKINVHATNAATQASANAVIAQANVWKFAGISFGSTTAIVATGVGIAAAGAVIGWRVSTIGNGNPQATISVGPPRLP